MAIGHWLKNYMKWYFDPNCESGGGGGGSSRVLVYENELDISSDGQSPIIYGTGAGGFIAPYYTIEDTFTLEVDGTVCATGKFVLTGGGAYTLGLTNPGDSAGLANYSGGVAAIAEDLNADKVPYVLTNNAMLDGSKFEKGTHSVKIYKEA